jgi:hypothetical protein
MVKLQGGCICILDKERPDLGPSLFANGRVFSHLPMRGIKFIKSGYVRCLRSPAAGKAGAGCERERSGQMGASNFFSQISLHGY